MARIGSSHLMRNHAMYPRWWPMAADKREDSLIISYRTHSIITFAPAASVSIAPPASVLFVRRMIAASMTPAASDAPIVATLLAPAALATATAAAICNTQIAHNIYVFTTCTML